MSDVSPLVRVLVREALEHEGRVPLATLAEQLVPLATLRELARKHGLSPRGYRVEKAPSARLVPLLADPRRPEVLEELVAACFEPVLPAESKTAPTADAARCADLNAKLARREYELGRVQHELTRCRTQGTRQREREAELVTRLQAADASAAAARAEAEDARRRLEAQRPPAAPADGAAGHRIHALERDVEALLEAEDGLRRLLALRQVQVRNLEEQIAELRELVPERKRRKQAKPAAPALSDRFRLPHFTPSFYKSLVGHARRHIEQAMQAALLFCTEGHSYPGLEVKRLEGQDLWSLRASLKLRVYFVMRGDEDVDFVAIADREDQHTTLRRLKER